MPTTCSAVNCTNRFKKGSRVTFHCFPLQDKSLLKKWMRTMRRAQWTPNKFSRLCSEHFEETCFKYNNDRRYLLPNSIPSIFNFPLHLQKRIAKHKKLKKMKNYSSQEVCSSISNTEEICSAIPNKEAFFTTNNNEEICSDISNTETLNEESLPNLTVDHNYSLPSPDKLKKKLDKYKEKVTLLQKELKISRQKIRRKTEHINNLENVIKHLRLRLIEHEVSVADLTKVECE